MSNGLKYDLPMRVDESTVSMVVDDGPVFHGGLSGLSFDALSSEAGRRGIWR